MHPNRYDWIKAHQKSGSIGLRNEKVAGLPWRLAGRRAAGLTSRVLAVAGGGPVTAVNDPVDEADHAGAAGQIPEGDWNQIADET